jgi:glycosyltransferase involved in cell wall biosynthesis
MHRAGIRALVYGDVNLNVIDGSAIWAQSTVEVLARAGCAVTLLLKAPVRTDRLVAPLERLPGVTIARPFEDALLEGLAGDRLTIPQATAIMRRLDEQQHFDIVLLRGFALARFVVADGAFDGRLWTYLTDIPQSVSAMDAGSAAAITAVVEVSRFVLCQTEELRAFLEGTIPAACGRSVLFPPVVPAAEFPVPPPHAPHVPVRLVYSGKFAPRWKTLEMTGLPALMAARGLPAELHAIGDKIHREPSDPEYFDRMGRALRSTPGVIWHGGQSRQDAMRLCAEGDIGLGWRDRSLDSSLELSTKILEYGSIGLPIILNRTPMHEALLGPDYPLFARSQQDVVDAVAMAVAEPGLLSDAVARCAAAAARYSVDRAVESMGTLLDRAFPETPLGTGRERPLRVVVASHDLKFFSRILDHFQALPELDVRLDRWPALAQHDPAASAALAAWADVVVCEWAGPNAVWYSRHKRPGQRLVVRLHRFELGTGSPREIAIRHVDQVICVSPHYARLTSEQTHWPHDKLTVVANWVDDRQLDRPKLEGAMFHLGMIGAAPARKRLDLAIDTLARLRAADPRFQLFVKTKMPWDYEWVWRKEEERAHYDDILRRVQVDPLVRGAVTFDAFGPDVATWLRRVGWMLSTSDDESFHLAPAEGMASGAVPVVRNWPGADTIYDPRWIEPDPAAMADRIARTVRDGTWDREREIARAQAHVSFGLAAVTAVWVRVLFENLPAWDPGQARLMPPATEPDI